MTSKGIEPNRHPRPAAITRLEGALLTQCRPEETEIVGSLANREGGGLVITATDRGGMAAAYSAVRHLLDIRQFTRPVLLDANKYFGQSRRTADTPFDPDWTRRQRELGLAVLTDSGYIGADDELGLISILSRSRDLGDDVIATLPIHYSWLSNPSKRDSLIGHVQQTNIPVAVILEHENDPLGTKAAVEGLVMVSNSGPPVHWLRSDVSAVGALCYGAAAGAVGTRTALRHLYPLPTGTDSQFFRKPEPAAFIKEGLAFVSLTKIFFARRADPENSLWLCSCTTCAESPLAWLAMFDEEQKQRKAFAHSIEVLLDLRDALYGPGMDIARRRTSWLAQCENAQFRHMEVQSLNPWNPPKFLAAWRKATITAPLQEHVP